MCDIYGFYLLFCVIILKMVFRLFFYLFQKHIYRFKDLCKLLQRHTKKLVVTNLLYFLQHAPGVPKVLIGNRLHLAFKRQVSQSQAEQYAAKNHMNLFEVSPLCDFNIVESFTELSRLALKRNGMERLWRANKGENIGKMRQKVLVGNHRFEC